MGRYTRKEFMEYYDFKDEPETIPATFHRKQKGYENLIENVRKDVKVGVKLIDAIRLNAQVTREMANGWKRAFVKEIEDGKTDTPLIRLFTVGLKSDAALYRKVMGLVMERAEEGDTTATLYLAKHRLGYNSTTKQEVELSSKEDAPIKFEFVDMTPTDADNEEEADE